MGWYNLWGVTYIYSVLICVCMCVPVCVWVCLHCCCWHDDRIFHSNQPEICARILPFTLWEFYGTLSFRLSIWVTSLSDKQVTASKDILSFPLGITIITPRLKHPSVAFCLCVYGLKCLPRKNLFESPSR